METHKTITGPKVGRSANETLWGANGSVFTPIRSFPDNDERAPPLPPLLLRDQLLGCQERGRKRETPAVSQCRVELLQSHYFKYTTSSSDAKCWAFNLLSPKPVFQVSGSKMTCPAQMTITSLLKGLN